MSTPPLPAGYALDATPPLPAGYALDSGAPAEQPSTYSKLTAPLNQNAEEWAAQHPVIGPAVRLLDAAGGAAISTPEGILNALSHPVDTAKATSSGIAAWFDPKTRPTWEQIKSVLPEALGQGVGNVAAGEAAGPIAKAVKTGAGAVSDATGFSNTLANIKPDLVSHLEKTHSFTGQAAAYLADKMLPDSPEALASAKRMAEEGTAKDINDAIVLQDTYNRRVAREQAATQRTQAAQDRIAARQKATADARAAKADAEARAPQSIKQSPNYNPEAYQAGRASINPEPPSPEEQPVYPGAALPAAEDFYANRGEDIARAMKQQPEAFAPPAQPTFPGASLPSAEEFYSQRGEELNDIRKMQDLESRRRAAQTKATQDTGLKLPSLSGGPKTLSEGRPATWTNDTVRQLAAWGDTDAMDQARLRGFGTIPKNYSTVNLTPKSTTLFDASGSPIAPNLKGGPGDFASQAAEPKYLYRIRPVGEKGVPAAAANSPAQLTTSLEQAESWAPSKNEEGPHEIVRIPTSSLKPGQTSARPFSPEIDWHKALQAIPESDVEVVRPHRAEVESE